MIKSANALLFVLLCIGMADVVSAQGLEGQRTLFNWSGSDAVGGPASMDEPRHVKFYELDHDSLGLRANDVLGFDVTVGHSSRHVQVLKARDCLHLHRLHHGQ